MSGNEENKKLMEKVKIYSNGIFHCSACADGALSKDEVEKSVNLINPSGTTHGWRIYESSFRSGETNPCKCNVKDSKKHWLLTC